MEFLRFAESLAPKITDETQLRVCIGRIYYAAHLSAREKIRPHYPGLFLSDDGCKGEHDLVRDKLIDLDNDVISDLLFKLSELRVRADYYITSYQHSEWKSELEYAISLCNEILSSIDKIP